MHDTVAIDYTAILPYAHRTVFIHPDHLFIDRRPRNLAMLGCTILHYPRLARAESLNINIDRVNWSPYVRYDYTPTTCAVKHTRQMGHFRVEHVVDTHDKQATFAVDCTGNAR